jgi:TolA-binding protein
MENGLKRCEAHWLLAAGLSLGLMFAGQGQAQTFEDGYQSYMRNQFPVAELQFRAAVKKAKTKEDRAFIQKFIGICQFMRGDKKSAANSFNGALNSDRNITIDDEEVLDPGVVSFFAMIKTRWLNSPEARVAAGPAPAPVARPAPPLPMAFAQAPKPPVQEAPPAPRMVPSEPKAAPTLAEKLKKKKAKEAAKAEVGGRIISGMHFMPLGLGQFHNDSYIPGSAFAAGQVFSLYQVLSLDKQIADENAQNDEVTNNPNIPQAEKDKFLLDNARYIDDLTSDKSTAATTFAALYVVSVVQALIFAPRHPLADESRRETSKIPNRNRISTAWIPGNSGGTYLVQLRLNLE